MLRDQTGIPIVNQCIVANGRMLKGSDMLPAGAPAELTLVQSCISTLPRRVICILNVPVLVPAKIGHLRNSVVRLLRRILPPGSGTITHSVSSKPALDSNPTAGFMLLMFETENTALHALQLAGRSVMNLMRSAFGPEHEARSALPDGSFWHQLRGQQLEVIFLQDALRFPNVDVSAASMVESLRDANA